MQAQVETDGELGRALHQLLLAGDPTATGRISEAYYDAVRRWLRRKNPGERDDHLLDDAACRAFMGYFDRPQQYHPEKSPLLAYLQMSAQGDYKNLLASETTIAKRTTSLVVGVAEADVEPETELELADDADVEAEVLSRLDPIWDKMEELFPKENDRRLLQLMIDGVRETGPYAQELAITHLPPAVQAHEVKKAKDRIKRRIQRNLDRAELAHDD